MPEPSHDVRRKLVERVVEVVDAHRPGERGPGGTVTCRCGADDLSDHPRHVAGEIIDRLGVKPDIDEVKKRIRYASAWFNWELTVLEGAE